MYSASQYIMSANYFAGNVLIQATCKSSGAGRITFLLAVSLSPLSGYLFKFSAIQGEKLGQILRLDSGVATDISSYASGVANAAQLAGTHNLVAHYFASTGEFQITIDSVLIAVANDASYLVNGPIGYAAEVVVGTIPSLQINGHQEILTTNTVLPNVTGLAAALSNKQDIKLTWGPLSPLPSGFDSYEIREGPVWGSATPLARVKTSSYLIIDPAPGAATYWVGVRAQAGFYDPGPASVTFTMPSPGDVTGLTASITTKQDVQLAWKAPSSLPTGFAAYEIRYAATNVGWANATLLTRTTSNSYLITSPTPGTCWYWVGVRDLAGNNDLAPPSASVTVPYPPDVTGLTAGITTKQDVLIAWTAPPVLPDGFDSFEIRYAAEKVGWANATFLTRTKLTSYLIPSPKSGTTYYWVGVRDLAGSYDLAPPYAVVTVPYPADVTGLTATVTTKRDIQLAWRAPSPLPTGFEAYEIRYASSPAAGWAGAKFLDRIKTANYLFVSPAVGTTYYWVGVLDLAGSYSQAPPYVAAALSAIPDVTGLAAAVTTKNDIYLTWNPVNFSGFSHYEIRFAYSNVGFAAATYGNKTKNESFLSQDPPPSQITYYWVAAVDLNGNYSPNPPHVVATLTKGFSLDTVPFGAVYSSTLVSAQNGGVPNQATQHLFPTATVDASGTKIAINPTH